MRNLWSKNELIICFCLYLKIPFGKISTKSIEIIELAEVLNRTPSSIAMRLSNFASIDPLLQERGIKGLSGGYNQVKPIWIEFHNNQKELFLIGVKILNQFNSIDHNSKLYQLLFLSEIDGGNSSGRSISNKVNESEINYSTSGSVLTLPILLNDKLLLEKLVPLLKKNKVLEAVEVCTLFYVGKYKSMTFKDWFKLINNIYNNLSPEDNYNSDLETPQSYSEDELDFFKKNIILKLREAKDQISLIDQKLISENNNETIQPMKDRTIKFIHSLEQALNRIKNKTYGICRITGELIPKERLIAVPHVTVSIKAKKLNRKKRK